MISGISPREKPSEDYFKYFKEMHAVGNLLNQIARQLYYFKQVNYKSLNEALGLYTELSKKILADKCHDEANVNEIINCARENGVIDVWDFKKIIGNTTYVVKSHFNSNSNEDILRKVQRMVGNDNCK